MTDRSKRERDQRALDALFVSQLRRHERCDEVDLNRLPKLTKEEMEVLDSLGPGFIGQLLAGDIPPIPDDSSARTDEELLCAGGMTHGMNRAEEIDTETAAEIARKRNEIIEKLKNKKDRQDG